MFDSVYRGYALATLSAVYMLNLVDRGLMMLLLQPIKEDLRLTDTQLGFVTGIAFGLFYAVLGVPIARWADRGNRVTITSLSIGLWALTVMGCLFVANYLHLLIARMAAAVGESGCKPPTYSLIGDYFPEPAQRVRAMAVYIGSSQLAILLSFVIGGWLNESYGWRITFMLMGVPGLVLAVIVKLTIREPRVVKGYGSKHFRKSFSVLAVLSTLWGRSSCRHLCLALVLLYMVTLGLGPWYAAFMMRTHGMTTSQLGISLGLIFSLGSVAGVLIGGYAAGRWLSDNERGQMRMSAISVTCVVPFFVAFLLSPNADQALLSLIPLMVVLGAFLAPTYSLMQRLVVDEMRATMMAVVMLLSNLVGFGLGPLLVGVLSDWLEPFVGGESLRYAMLMLSVVAAWSGYHFWQVGRNVDMDLASVRGLDFSRQRSL